MIPGGKHGQNLINLLLIIQRASAEADALFHSSSQYLIMKFYSSILVLMIAVTACTEQNRQAAIGIKKIDHAWLDSIIQASDSVYEKPYKRTDFVTAVFYLNRKNSSVCQVMKDSANVIRQIILVNKNVRTHFAQYFANGQLQAELPLDAFGQYDGKAVSYYEDGRVQDSGHYAHGFKTGVWKNFDRESKLISEDEFDVNGQLIKTTKQ